MPQSTSIEWTQYSWNPVTGCTKVSSGCKNCYAERMANRLRAMGVDRYKSGFQIRTHPDLLDIPMRLKRPRLIFVNSMSDLFHERIPVSFIEKIFSVMNQCPQHTFQILTKRSKRLVEISPRLSWSSNIWMGVTVEDAKATGRVKDLAKCNATVKFVSCEPLLGAIDALPMEGVNWVIVGGESGPHARPMEESWAIGVRDQCLSVGVPYFFKQWGGWNNKARGRILEGRVWGQMPISC